MNDESSMPMHSYAIAERKEQALQARYVAALMQQSPGLGEKSHRIAEDLVASGLNQSESFMLIQAVYDPSRKDGKGQGTRLKHFAKAVQDRYGEVGLYNASQSVESFRGLLFQISEAVTMRDTLNGSISDASFSFDDTLRFQELGLDSDVVMDAFYKLTSPADSPENNGYYREVSTVEAVMRIKQATRQLERGTHCTLESLLFPTDMDGFVGAIMANDTLGRPEDGSEHEY